MRTRSKIKAALNSAILFAATLFAAEPVLRAQALNTQILLPDPAVSPSMTPYAYGKALLMDPQLSASSGPDYQSLFLGTLSDGTLPSIWRIDPDPSVAPAFSSFSMAPLDSDRPFRFVTQLAYNKAEKALYASGDVIVQYTKPKRTGLVWLVRRSDYAQSGDAISLSDSDMVVLAQGAESRAQGIAVDAAGNVYVCGRAKDSKGISHSLVRRKALGATSPWSTVYDVKSSALVLETKIGYFPGSPTFPAAVLKVGNENNKWTIFRSLTGNSGSWTQVDTAWSAANSPAGAKDIAYDVQSGKLYVVGYRGTFGANANGWVVRVSADGGQNWSTLLDAPCNPYSYPNAVTTDALGGVLITGCVSVRSSDGLSWMPQIHLVRCTNPADAWNWQASFAGVPLPFDETNNSNDSFGSSITTDASGAIFATGVVSGWVDSRTSPATTYPGYNVGLLRLVP